jgi:hypothetical protein
MSAVLRLKRWFALLGIAFGIAGFAILHVWFCLRSQSVAPTPAAPAAVAAVSTTHKEALSVTTEEQAAGLEKRLKGIGFEVCWFKCGLNLSGHSLVRKYENVDFRIMVNHRTSGLDMPSIISVYLNADGPSLKEAEAASRRLLAQLDNKNGE